MAEEIGVWETLVYDNDYEIYSEYPYTIRKASNGKIISEFIHQEYCKVYIKSKQVFKHRLIAFQWIENDDPKTKTQIDHIDRNKLNNHIENLRWISPSDNMKNKDKVTKRKNEYLDELPENAIQVCDFEEIQLDRYYFDIDTERLLMETRTRNVRYKIIYPFLQNNQLRLNLIDENGKKYQRSYTRFMCNMFELL